MCPAVWYRASDQVLPFQRAQAVEHISSEHGNNCSPADSVLGLVLDFTHDDACERAFENISDDDGHAGAGTSEMWHLRFRPLPLRSELRQQPCNAGLRHPR